MSQSRRLSLHVVFSLLVAGAGAACAGDAAGGPAGPTPAPALHAGRSVPWPAPARAPSPGLRSDARPLPHDLVSLRSLGDITISPDGDRVAYTVRAPRFDPKAEPSPGDTRAGWTVEEQLWVVDRRGAGAPVQLTYGADPILAARFSPDGRDIAFLRKVAGKATLHILRLSGGEARPVALGEHEPTAFAWTPDGRSFAFLAARPRGADEKRAAWRRGGAIAWDREWRQVHLFLVGSGGGAPRHVNQGPDTLLAFRLSPDGARVAVLTSASADPYQSFTRQRLAILRTADGGVEREVEKAVSVIRDLEWSPDGRLLAYTTTARGFSHIDELRVVPVQGGAPRNLAAGLDLSLSSFAWAADSRSLVACAQARTRTALYRLPLAGKPRELPRGEFLIGPLVRDRRGRAAATALTGSRGPDVPGVVDLGTGRARALAELNPEVASWRLAPTRVVAWKNREGVALEGLLTRTRPGGGAAPPLLVLPHGGPDSVSLDGWDASAQFFAARGYSVFRPNYRGGIGYGRAFYEANRGRLGEIEIADIESGVDHLIASREADPERLFYGGWSWGGYLAARTLGLVHRYRAVMVGAGVVDVVAQYATSDINHGIVADWEFKGRPWKQPEAFDRASPQRTLAGARSPTLILHGQNDDRVGFVNSQILYRALVDLGVEVSMWAYPREGHGLDEPAHQQHRLEVWAAFNDAHLPR